MNELIVEIENEDFIIVGGDPIIKRYIIKVDPLVEINKASYFFKRVNEILTMDVRWKSYNFEYVGIEDFNSPNNTLPSKDYDFIIVLLDRSTKHKLLEMTNSKLQDQPLTDGSGSPIDFKSVEFSYTFFTTPAVVVIDNDNWETSHKKLEISKTFYEQYVIFHEVGHAIGKSHKPIPIDINKPYPIMYQATLGLPDLKRFVPYPNESDEN